MRLLAACAAVIISPAVLAQPSVFVDCAGASISSLSTNPPDVVRTSTGTIDAAAGYTFAFNPIVRGTGFLGVIVIPNDTPLGDVLNGFVVGSQRTLYGAVRNPGAGVPVTLDSETIAGTFSGISISLTFEQSILADRRGRSAIRNIVKPFGLGINVVSGGGVFQTFNPPPATVSEFHFEGNLQSVRQSGMAPASGFGLLRYLDDSAFGPILGGPAEINAYPNPPTPQNVTQAQSSFGLASSFGLPLPGGEDDVVYKTSPPRNAADPSNQAKSRGLGLAFWPNTRHYWPEDRNGQWTFVWDLLIPSAAWANEFAACLIEDNHNNDQSADAFIRVVGGQARFGYQVPFANDIALPGVQPNQWFRLAIASDGYRTKVGRVFVNGVYVGSTGGDWVYASCNKDNPRWGDVSSTNPTGTAVAPATWNAWGQFPSPWAQAPNASLAPMASTVCLFADLQGRGESIYIANMLYTDETLTDAQIGALGGVNARGIVHLRPPPAPACDPDVNCDGAANGVDVEVQELAVGGDFSDYCQPDADFNQDGAINGLDVEAVELVVGGDPCP
ncbi:MAG: hypothetical protein HBSAPP03_26890 [Phycisphaerae bacterium]|nr:MAG: hypothetical protein HBSAPP03_26890 [Phycisphaerae bacterium]